MKVHHPHPETPDTVLCGEAAAQGLRVSSAILEVTCRGCRKAAEAALKRKRRKEKSHA